MPDPFYTFPISQGFGPTSTTLDSPYGGAAHFNKGLDFAAPVGSLVPALVGGTVIAAGDSGDGWGISVKIRDAEGNIHNYGHLGSTSVKAGQQIAAGALVGASGNTGKSTGPHVSYDVANPQGVYIEPSRFVQQATTAPQTPPTGGTTMASPQQDQVAQARFNVPYEQLQPNQKLAVDAVVKEIYGVGAASPESQKVDQRTAFNPATNQQEYQESRDGGKTWTFTGVASSAPAKPDQPATGGTAALSEVQVVESIANDGGKITRRGGVIIGTFPDGSTVQYDPSETAGGIRYNATYKDAAAAQKVSPFVQKAQEYRAGQDIIAGHKPGQKASGGETYTGTNGASATRLPDDPYAAIGSNPNDRGISVAYARDPMGNAIGPSTLDMGQRTITNEDGTQTAVGLGSYNVMNSGHQLQQSGIDPRYIPGDPGKQTELLLSQQAKADEFMRAGLDSVKAFDTAADMKNPQLYAELTANQAPLAIPDLSSYEEAESEEERQRELERRRAAFNQSQSPQPFEAGGSIYAGQGASATPRAVNMDRSGTSYGIAPTGYNRYLKRGHHGWMYEQPPRLGESNNSGGMGGGGGGGSVPVEAPMNIVAPAASFSHAAPFTGSILDYPYGASAAPATSYVNNMPELNITWEDDPNSLFGSYAGGGAMMLEEPSTVVGDYTGTPYATLAEPDPTTGMPRPERVDITPMGSNAPQTAPQMSRYAAPGQVMQGQQRQPFFTDPRILRALASGLSKKIELQLPAGAMS